MRYFITLFLIGLCGFSTGWSAIYDCFMFNNELEVLELRIHELYDHVDKFVLVESVESHRLGTPKPCYFEQNQDRFKQYEDKIIYIKLEEHIESDNGWIRENWQRNQIMRGLTDCGPEDLILISDVDEFIPGEIIDYIYALSAQEPVIGFWQKMYRYFLNREVSIAWSGTAALRYKYLLHDFQGCPQLVRNIMIRERARTPFGKGEESTLLEFGWHFSSMGGYELYCEKCHDVVEGNDDLLTYEEWRADVDTHALVPIDDTYPKYIQENTELLTQQGLIDSPQ